MKVVILAGGLGSRLGEETAVRPKPMVEIGGMPILWHILKIYAAHGLTDFVICLGYKGAVIKAFFQDYFLNAADVTFDLASGRMEVHRAAAEPWRVTLVETGAATQTGGRLAAIRHHLPADEPFCFTYGDGVGDVDVSGLVAFHRAHGRRATVTAVAPPGRFGQLQFEGERVSHFLEKPAGDGGWVNGGFFVLEPAVLDLVEAPSTIWEFGPMEALAQAGELMAWRHRGFWQPMDTLRDRIQLEELWASGEAPWKLW